MRGREKPKEIIVGFFNQGWNLLRFSEKSRFVATVDLLAALEQEDIHVNLPLWVALGILPEPIWKLSRRLTQAGGYYDVSIMALARRINANLEENPHATVGDLQQVRRCSPRFNDEYE